MYRNVANLWWTVTTHINTAVSSRDVVKYMFQIKIVIEKSKILQIILCRGKRIQYI